MIIRWYNTKVTVKSLKDYAIGYESVSLTILISVILAFARGSDFIIGEDKKLFKLGPPFAIIEIFRFVS